MQWNELKISTTHQASEMIAAILIEAGSNGVAIEDPFDFDTLDDGFGQLKPEKSELYQSEEVFVSGYFPNTKNIVEIQMSIQEKLHEAEHYGLDLGKNEVILTSVSEEDWANAWKTYYHPVRISRYLTVVPSWENYQAIEGENIIELDPGMAFGTGTHPTTRLSLQALEMVLRGGEYVLDVGTGSGVLSIAAKVLGAARVEAFDLDEKATQIARENIALNPFAQDIVVRENDLLSGIKTQADVIVANILAEILERLIDDAWANLKDGGYFILAGIIQSKRDSLVDKLRAKGFEIEQENKIKDWVSLICLKPIIE
ncbi:MULTISPECIES: 50S ribosomal protein L11 methyltransferase [unclassified Granulicatella]|uniref:50S ribosomal protein L11 methyltransferase n=1 Tax=unclassified Granulicatella TaxID=2630493 RepID=UPI0010737E6E|nr:MULTISPECIES: 50S ribosomal protein L11 methyltransferase [unclassified Granulicatella]MBF0779494.1 50S ribosomal protein L11 methyltransferase [Granulicatella sp. 19428wC4_WM01]TFU96460.1 50S ribosomal protein L11 methyltransferase [Granulicatella sp. WM01]